MDKRLRKCGWDKVAPDKVNDEEKVDQQRKHRSTLRALKVMAVALKHNIFDPMLVKPCLYFSSHFFLTFFSKTTCKTYHPPTTDKVLTVHHYFKLVISVVCLKIICSRKVRFKHMCRHFSVRQCYYGNLEKKVITFLIVVFVSNFNAKFPSS